MVFFKKFYFLILVIWVISLCCMEHQFSKDDSFLIPHSPRLCVENISKDDSFIMLPSPRKLLDDEDLKYNVYNQEGEFKRNGRHEYSDLIRQVEEYKALKRWGKIIKKLKQLKKELNLCADDEFVMNNSELSQTED